MCNYPQLLPRIMIDVIISYIKQKTTCKIITVKFDKSKQVRRQKMSLGNNKIKSYQITKWCQELLRVQVPENGFDIQQQALDHTREIKMEKEGNLYVKYYF